MVALSITRSAFNRIIAFFAANWDQLIDYLLSHPTEEIVERKERLFQTYLIVFGLLLAYDFNNSFRASLMEWFIVFIICGLFYYVYVLCFYRHFCRYLLNLAALPLGYLFSSGLVGCLLYFNPSSHLDLTFWILAILVTVSLFV